MTDGTDWIGRRYASTEGWDLAESLVDLGGRMAGSDAEREAAALTRDALEGVGARRARIETFDIHGWSRGSSSIGHPDTGTRQPCIALPRSPSGAVEGELLDLGYGLPEDFERDVAGKVVVVQNGSPDRPFHRIEKYRAAVEAGAAAFVVYNHVDGCLERSGVVRGADGAPMGEIPALGTSFEVGKRLVRRFAGEPVAVEVDAETGPATSPNVHAQLGPETDESVIVSCHLDCHDISEGAGDDAIGAGAVLEVAAGLANRADELDRRVHLIGFGAEEMPLLGSAYFAGRADLSGVVAVVQNDGVARERDLELYTSGSDALGAIGRRVGERFDDPVAVTSEVSLDSDQWRLLERGVPGYAVSSRTPEGASALGSEVGRTVTPADTLEKLDPRDLRAHAVVETELVVELARDGVEVPRPDAEAVGERLDAADKRGIARAMALTGEEGDIETPAW